MNEDAITIYRFEDAPQKYKDLSDNGGDEDWIAILPPKFKGEYIGWLQSFSPFGCFVDEYMEGDWTILISSH